MSPENEEESRNFPLIIVKYLKNGEKIESKRTVANVKYSAPKNPHEKIAEVMNKDWGTKTFMLIARSRAAMEALRTIEGLCEESQKDSYYCPRYPVGEITRATIEKLETICLQEAQSKEQCTFLD